MKDTITLWLSRDLFGTMEFWNKEPHLYKKGHFEGHFGGTKGYGRGCISEVCSNENEDYIEALGINLKEGELMRFTGKKMKK